MTLKSYLWGIGLASCLALISFIAIVSFSSPESGNFAVLFLLFLSLFLSLCGFFSLLGFYFRQRGVKREEKLLLGVLGVSLRQGTLLGFLLIGLLLMRLLNFFFWWTVLIILAIIIGLEITFLYREKQ